MKWRRIVQRIGNYVQNNNYRPSFKAGINWESLGTVGKQIASKTASQEIRVAKRSIDEKALQLPENWEYKFNNFDLNKAKKIRIKLLVDGKTRAAQNISLSKLPDISVKNLLNIVDAYIYTDAVNYKNTIGII